MINKASLSSKFAVVSLLIVLFFLGNAKYKQWKNQREIDKQMQNIQQQADQLQKKNDELSQSLQYLNSDSFKERVAREQLNLKKEGETIYSFGDAKATTTDQVQSKGSNAQKWWSYFFSIQ